VLMSRRTATELRPVGSSATATSLRSLSSGRSSSVFMRETNGSRRPLPGYAYVSRLISTSGAADFGAATGAAGAAPGEVFAGRRFLSLAVVVFDATRTTF